MTLYYVTARECINPEAIYMCDKCGQCGRVFDEDGYLIDDGGTTSDEDE